MRQSVLLDNWTLQHIARSFEDGLSDGNADRIIIDAVNDTHTLQKYSEAAVQIRALFDLLSAIVLHDHLIVEDKYSYTWDRTTSTLARLAVQPFFERRAFAERWQTWVEPRTRIIRDLCVTTTLRQAQTQNERSYAATGQSDQPLLAQLIWGTAGMLARSQVEETSYMAHPMRQDLIAQTPIAIMPTTASEITFGRLNRVRSELIDGLIEGACRRRITFNVPPIAAEIIAESKGVAELILVAMQMREKYQPLRLWLGEYETALADDDVNALAKKKAVLDDIEKGIESYYKRQTAANTTIALNLGWFSLSVPLQIRHRILNRFGVRSLLTHLTLNAPGEKALRKLLSMFDETNSAISAGVFTALREQ